MKGKEKEMNEQDNQEISFFADPSDDENDMLTLSLSFPSSRSELDLSEQQQPPRRYESSSSSSSHSVPQQPPMQMFLVQRAPPPPPSSPSQHNIHLASVLAQPLYMPFFLEQDPSSSSARLLYHRQRKVAVGPSRPLRARRNPTQRPGEGKSDDVAPPFPWATSQRATVYSLTDLHSKQILTITGQVQCKRCGGKYTLEYNLKEKFNEVGTFILENKNNMHDRAPPVWMNPVLSTCKVCNKENSAKPIIADKKKNINWLFLLLGQMLGCCKLKYFCKHTRKPRRGAKDRVLYLTYLGLCKQVDPSGPFNC